VTEPKGLNQNLPLKPDPGIVNIVHILTTHLFKISFNSIFLATFSLPRGCLLEGFSTQIFTYVLFPHSAHWNILDSITPTNPEERK
jgi:hypothetical protein